MKLSTSVCGIASIAVVVLMTAACSSDDDSSAPAATTTITTTQTDTARSSAAATASSMMSTVRATAQQAVQDAINTVLATAPITFDAGSSDLSTVATATLKAVAVPLKGNDTKIEITTYAEDSNTGTAKSLAEARGDNIAAELESSGIDKSRITVKSDANPSDSQVDPNTAAITVVDE
ncbi:OmpA family protein [Nocardia alba]|uniref:Outer membrane protein OmpA-like peptidoglycan-associated protein n=1 Tax=Nocardia alba TaxID=225051 RepID=A0A4R1FH80_9NOCA|nr:OmpA family protein [Nocardia alba]TCJ93753.1 outer membrane protein OmpA-like peptidoglycan-associated protein [Nocardia alba]